MTKRLDDLHPHFVGKIRQSEGYVYERLASIDGAQGVLFDCPKCENHSVLVLFRGREVPEDFMPSLARWDFDSGTGTHDLTLSPSIQLIGGCNWHGFVKNGEVLTC